MTEPIQKRKGLSEYQQLKEGREKDMTQQLEQVLYQLKSYIWTKDTVQCRENSIHNGVLDEIDQKLCLKQRRRLFDEIMIKMVPDLTQHHANFQDCLNQCHRNHINYLVAHQSCRSVYERNFKKSAESLVKKIVEAASRAKAK